MPTLNSKDGITNFAKKTPAAYNLVLSADEHQPKAENYEGDEEEKRKSARPETTASTSVKTSSIYGFSIVDLLTVSGPSCSRHRRRSATTMISTRKNNEKIKELDEPPIKKTFKSESYDIKEENLHSKPYNDAFLHFHRTDKPSPQYQQPLSTVKQDHQVISLNTTCPSATETAWQQQMNMAATFFIQNQSQKQEIGEAAALERMLALVRGREVLAAFPSFDDRNDQLEELKKKMTAAALLPSSLTNLPNFLNQNNIPYTSGNSNRSNEKMLEILAANQQYIMDAQKQQRRQDFLSFLTRAKDDKGEKEGNSPTASRQNSLDEESPAGDESDEGDDCRETSDEEPPSISGVMPSIKSFYSSKSESNTGIRKKKTRTVFSRGQVNLLESAFNAHRYLNSQQRTDLARTLSLTETQVKIWFQNRRNKWKRISGANIDFNEPVENNNDIPTLPPPSTFLFQQHPNFQKNDVSNFSLAYATASHVQNYYEQSSSINNDINNDANNSNPASSSVIPVDNTAINSAIVLQQAQRFLISFLTSSATLQSSSASPPPSVLPPGGKENNASKNFTSTASILSSAVVPEQFTTP